ncbi:hypothetical protein HHI36_014412, partial [Cryptolaemus montrouzieri]
MGTYYTQAIKSWMRSHSSSSVTQYQVGRLINEPYERAATIANIVYGFKATVTWFVNRNIFQDHHFAPAGALVTNVISAGRNNSPLFCTPPFSREYNVPFISQ